MNLYSFRIQKIDAEDLFGLPGYMQKLRKPINYLKKQCVAKIAKRSSRFSRLADANNICVVYNNEPCFKKLFVKQKLLK